MSTRFRCFGMTEGKHWNAVLEFESFSSVHISHPELHNPVQTLDAFPAILWLQWLKAPIRELLSS